MTDYIGDLALDNISSFRRNDRRVVLGGYMDSAAERDSLAALFDKAPGNVAINTLVGDVQKGYDLTTDEVLTKYCMFDSDYVVDGWYMLRRFSYDASRLQGHYPFRLELFYVGAATEVNDCDALTDWTGTSLSQETTDKIEGTGAVKNTVATPVVETYYASAYNPAGTWDWSAKNQIAFWLKCDRVSTAFTVARFYVTDSLDRHRYWNLTFNAGVWKRHKKLIGTYDGQTSGFDITDVDEVSVRFQAADTTAFYTLIDFVIL